MWAHKVKNISERLRKTFWTNVKQKKTEATLEQILSNLWKLVLSDSDFKTLNLIFEVHVRKRQFSSKFSERNIEENETA